MRRLLIPLATASALTAVSILTALGQTAHEHPAALAAAGEISVGSGWARAMLPGQPTGGGYLTITNTGSEPDRLVSVTSDAAGKVEVHRMEMANDVMTMRAVEGGLEIPAGATVRLEPGGVHLMFMRVAEPFAEGGSVPLVLSFEKAGEVEVSLPVRKTAPHGH